MFVKRYSNPRGLEGSRRLRIPDFKTISTWRWQVCQPYAPAAFTPPPPPHKKYSRYSFLLEANSTPGPECDWKKCVNKKQVLYVIVAFVRQSEVFREQILWYGINHSVKYVRIFVHKIYNMNMPTQNTVRLESRCALMLRYVDLVVRI
jgi:hypothetical protein